MINAPHYPSSFINALSEEGTKEEDIEYLQKKWTELCEARDRIRELEAKRDALRERMEAIYEICVEPAETDHGSVRRWIEVESRNAIAPDTEGSE